MKLLSLPAALALAALPVYAQDPIASPQINKEDVSFRIKAPEAAKVEVSGQWDKWQHTAMTKDEKGIWSASIPHLPPGIWEYHFTVDGVTMVDPRNPAIKPQREPSTSILQIPSDPPAPWDLSDAPHGVLHTHTYLSKALGRTRELIVYTPAGYSGAGDPLPTLYLEHGFSDNERTWTVHGKAHWIADGLIAAKRAKPMLIVMADAHALPPKGGGGDYGHANTAAFINELREDIRPLIEANYHVRSDGEGRAFAGLSMGGRHALTLGLTHPDEFRWIAAFSAAPPAIEDVRAAAEAPDHVRAELKMLWAPIGRDDFLRGAMEKFAGQAKDAGLAPELQITDGDHSWPVWRGYLVELLPRLFR